MYYTGRPELIHSMSDLQQQLDSQADTWVLVTLPLLLAAIGLAGMFLLAPATRSLPRLIVAVASRRRLGDLTPVQKFEHDGWTSTVYQERRLVRGEARIGWVVIDEYADGSGGWHRHRTVDAAFAHADDDGLMREW